MNLYIGLTNLLKRKIVPKLNKFTKTAFSDKYIFCTNTTLSISLSGLGDVIQQHYEIVKGELDTWDRRRTLHMSSYGMVVGMFCHHWYKFLDGKFPDYTIRTVCKKVLIDQLICSPICVTLLFVTTGYLENAATSEILQEFKQKGLKLYIAEWVVWPPAQVINFYFLPTKYRVLYDNIISLGYDVYTSYVKHEPIETKDSTR